MKYRRKGTLIVGFVFGDRKTGDDGGTELWLSILGEVYDVSEGTEYYAPGKSYGAFAGRDASVPFVTGKFVSAVHVPLSTRYFKSLCFMLTT